MPKNTRLSRWQRDDPFASRQAFSGNTSARMMQNSRAVIGRHIASNGRLAYCRRPAKSKSRQVRLFQTLGECVPIQGSCGVGFDVLVCLTQGKSPMIAHKLQSATSCTNDSQASKATCSVPNWQMMVRGALIKNKWVEDARRGARTDSVLH